MLNIKILYNNSQLGYKDWVFPGGEIGVKLDGIYHKFSPTIVARVQNSNDLFGIALIKDALCQIGCSPAKLFLPYIPYQQQDRVCDKGESFSLKVMADYINGLKFPEVIVCNPHSDVAAGVFDNIRIISQLDIINSWQNLINIIISDPTSTIFVSPDAGANKKTAQLAKYFGHSSFIRADKLRDLTNGNIIETIVYSDDLSDKNLFIFDDIVVGGQTFIELAKVCKRKQCKKLTLVATHGIFSKGYDVLYDSGIDEIYTTNSYKLDYPKDDRLHVLDIEKFI